MLAVAPVAVAGMVKDGEPSRRHAGPGRCLTSVPGVNLLQHMLLSIEVFWKCFTLNLATC